MPTVREDIAQLRKMVNSVHLDTRITNQFLYNKIIDVAKLIIRRDADSRKIYNTLESFASLECVELEQTDIKNCTNIWIPKCSTVMKSVDPLPKAFLSANASIVQVFSIDEIEGIQFIQTTPSKFVSIQKREYKGSQRYFWINDEGYLIIPNSFISAVKVYGLFIDRSGFSKNPCQGILDSESPLPDALRMDILRVAASEIAGVMKRIPEDSSPDMNPNKMN